MTVTTGELNLNFGVERKWVGDEGYLPYNWFTNAHTACIMHLGETIAACAGETLVPAERGIAGTEMLGSTCAETGRR